MMKQRHTPVESHTLPDGTSVLVKHEDLCFAEPAPPFSKLRGLVEHLQKIKRDKPTITHIAYVESAVSMAGWAWPGHANLLDSNQSYSTLCTKKEIQTTFLKFIAKNGQNFHPVP